MFVLRMKDVRPVCVHHDARFVTLGMAVASHVIASVENGCGMSSLDQLSSHHST
jgi:hypothetical protein